MYRQASPARHDQQLCCGSGLGRLRCETIRSGLGSHASWARVDRHEVCQLQLDGVGYVQHIKGSASEGGRKLSALFRVARHSSAAWLIAAPSEVIVRGAAPASLRGVVYRAPSEAWTGMGCSPSRASPRVMISMSRSAKLRASVYLLP